MQGFTGFQGWGIHDTLAYLDALIAKGLSIEKNGTKLAFEPFDTEMYSFFAKDFSPSIVINDENEGLYDTNPAPGFFSTPDMSAFFDAVESAAFSVLIEGR